VLEGKTAWKVDKHRADIASAMLRSISSEAVNGPAQDKTERAALIEKAWEFANLACDSAMTDLAYDAATQLMKWRLRSSGAPRSMGKFEAIITPKFGNYDAALTGVA